jgi:hypothetical protein
MLASGSRDDQGDAFTSTRLGMRTERDRPAGRSADSTLSDARRSLIHRYMTAEVEAAPREDADEPIVRAHAAAAESVAPPIELPPLPLLPALPPRPAEPEPEPEPVAADGDAPAAIVKPDQPRRGRPRGRKQRRQVHFHVDAEEDRLLLAAARQFGSQQKGLIAALTALQEVVSLREQVGQLHAECERQRELLAQAQALFDRQAG